ncbi:hypothetical protein ACFWBI_36815 [Streptomyces sp. NPDC059982]|uniref:hypothetical protein n=1 Tax=unclassified Streptomyces TaxID=2593676 RepID=UPI0036A4DE36
MPEPDISAQPEPEPHPAPLPQRQVKADQIAQAGLPDPGPEAPASGQRTLAQTRTVWSCLRPYGSDVRRTDAR